MFTLLNKVGYQHFLHLRGLKIGRGEQEEKDALKTGRQTTAWAFELVAPREPASSPFSCGLGTPGDR